MKLPQLYVHIRISSTVPVADVEALRTALVATVERHAEFWGARIKRRQVTPAQAAQLRAAYERRAEERQT